jgi:nitroreductase
MMDVVEAIRTIRAVRRYQGKPVPEATVSRIVEAGRLTGSAMNAQPWHFIVVQDRDTLRRLGALARTGPYIAEAPLAIVVAVEPTRFAVSDASRAIQSMMLAAWADGVGSNWVGFVGGLEEAKAVLQIPATLEVVAILPFGYPAGAVGRGNKARKPLTRGGSPGTLWPVLCVGRSALARRREGPPGPGDRAAPAAGTVTRARRRGRATLCAVR